VRVPLAFLPRGTTFQATTYKDGEERTSLVKDSATVSSKDMPTVSLLKNGGFAVHLRPPAAP
jgi:hypothetical protein